MRNVSGMVVVGAIAVAFAGCKKTDVVVPLSRGHNAYAITKQAANIVHLADDLIQRSRTITPTSEDKFIVDRCQYAQAIYANCMDHALSEYREYIASFKSGPPDVQLQKCQSPYDYRQCYFMEPFIIDENLQIYVHTPSGKDVKIFSELPDEKKTAGEYLGTLKLYYQFVAKGPWQESLEDMLIRENNRLKALGVTTESEREDAALKDAVAAVQMTAGVVTSGQNPALTKNRQ